MAGNWKIYAKKPPIIYVCVYLYKNEFDTKFQTIENAIKKNNVRCDHILG